ncbi:MAG: hypothetical protein GF313_09080 [Caldithrix sp.]|nr:hypothetical protein [Caldithrix sp.]
MYIRTISFGLLLIFIHLAVSSSLARELKQSEMIQSPVRSDMWLFAEGVQPVSLSGQTIMTEYPIAVQSRQLVMVDRQSALILNRSLEDEGIDYTLHNWSGKPISTFGHDWSMDMPLPKVLINGSDQTLVLVFINGTIQKRSFDGDILWEQRLVSSAVFTYENTYFALRSSNEKHYFIALSAPDPSSATFNTYLFKISEQGRVIGQRTIEGTQVLNVDGAHTHEALALMLKHTGDAPQGPADIRTVIVDGQLNTLWQLSSSFRAVTFHGLRCLIRTKTNVKLVDYQSKEQIWQQSIERDHRIYIHSQYDGQTVTLLSGIPQYNEGKLSYTAPVLEQRSWQNRLLYRERLPHKGLSSVHYNAASPFPLQLGFETKVMQYEMIHEESGQ